MVKSGQLDVDAAIAADLHGVEPRGETLSGRIVRELRDDLFSGKLEPGQRLGTEASLAERFGVSRMAVRDSLRTLEASGIVDIRVGARGGIFVATANADRLAETLAIQIKLIGVDLEEILDAQIAIEVMAAELAARNATAEDMAHLLRLIATLQDQIEAPDAFTQTSMSFHEALVGASNNRVLIAQFKALRHVLEPVYARRTTSEIAHRAIASHKAVVACIEARDPDAARDLMRRRLQVIRARHLIRELPS
ncbi:DNA-binding transcriptional regulator, FadR family [Rhizobiales bacterium GAS191]|nr:DNA-binding transcriptional regulator, FadR family [Rhizobiales bacterium GAS188]SED32816.1 DNA-binding transcriptional regulator, FadR family [Rhizobiales bacterium GAS191]